VGVDEQATRGGEGGGGLLWVPSARVERRKWREGLELNGGLGGEWWPRGAGRRGRGSGRRQVPGTVAPGRAAREQGSGVSVEGGRYGKNGQWDGPGK
jgi:hypothetical protein